MIRRLRPPKLFTAPRGEHWFTAELADAMVTEVRALGAGKCVGGLIQEGPLEGVIMHIQKCACCDNILLFLNDHQAFEVSPDGERLAPKLLTADDLRRFVLEAEESTARLRSEGRIH